MAKWTKETRRQIRPLPRIEDITVPPVGLIRCGRRFRMSFALYASNMLFVNNFPRTVSAVSGRAGFTPIPSRGSR